MKPQDFVQKFDRAGHYLASDGVEEVLFVTRSRKEYRGKLHFQNGLCVRAEMDGGGDWSWPDGSPLNQVSFLLKFNAAANLWVGVELGRMSFPRSDEFVAQKKSFLSNLRIARNLFDHSSVAVLGNASRNDSATRTLIRAAIWLTPKSVAGFDSDFFPELGPEREAELVTAVESFRKIAETVPSNAPASEEQYAGAKTAFEIVLSILTPYLPSGDSESRSIEKALAAAVEKFPAWVVNWDYELGPDSVGEDALWVRLFVDERGVDTQHMGRDVSNFASEVRTALNREGIARWPFVRMRSSAEHKAGA